MKTLIIYDKEGCIIQQITGSYRKPVGIPFIEVEIPAGKYIEKVDVANNAVVYKDLPKSEFELQKLEIEKLKKDVADLTMELAVGGVK